MEQQDCLLELPEIKELVMGYDADESSSNWLLLRQCIKEPGGRPLSLAQFRDLVQYRKWGRKGGKQVEAPVCKCVCVLVQMCIESVHLCVGRKQCVYNCVWMCVWLYVCDCVSVYRLCVMVCDYRHACMTVCVCVYSSPRWSNQHLVRSGKSVGFFPKF